MKPRLLLLDEPMASLDATRKREILPYFKRLRDETGLPMIYVSHDPDEVKALANRVVMLDAGRVTGTSDIEAHISGAAFSASVTNR
jgi:molybdate transport system ATP-binding protein